MSAVEDAVEIWVDGFATPSQLDQNAFFVPISLLTT